MNIRIFNIRNLEKNKTKIENIYIEWEKDTLDDVFDFAHSNVMNIIKIDEDKEFLILQR